MIGPALIEVAVAGLASAVAAGVSGNLVTALKSAFSRRPNRVELKLRSGQTVVLDLDSRLPSEKRGELVTAAVRSAEAGDAAGLKRVVEASHAASVGARGA